jgi:hypothetical protein
LKGQKEELNKTPVMILRKLAVGLLYIVLISCNQPDSVKIQAQSSTNSVTKNKLQTPAVETSDNNTLKITKGELLRGIQSAIIPIYKDWLILKNGTYIIFDNIDTIADVKISGLRWLEHYRPRTTEEQNWDYSITDLDQSEGWAVFGNGYGIYTFVSPKELIANPSAEQIGNFAKSKRASDEHNPEIIYINSVNGLEEVK